VCVLRQLSKLVHRGEHLCQLGAPPRKQPILGNRLLLRLPPRRLCRRPRGSRRPPQHLPRVLLKGCMQLAGGAQGCHK
jgi:hypothetical protein